MFNVVEMIGSLIYLDLNDRLICKCCKYRNDDNDLWSYDICIFVNSLPPKHHDAVILTFSRCYKYPIFKSIGLLLKIFQFSSLEKQSCVPPTCLIGRDRQTME